MHDRLVLSAARATTVRPRARHPARRAARRRIRPLGRRSRGLRRRGRRLPRVPAPLATTGPRRRARGRARRRHGVRTDLACDARRLREPVDRAVRDRARERSLAALRELRRWAERSMARRSARGRRSRSVRSRDADRHVRRRKRGCGGGEGSVAATRRRPLAHVRVVRNDAGRPPRHPCGRGRALDGSYPLGDGSRRERGRTSLDVARSRARRGQGLGSLHRAPHDRRVRPRGWLARAVRRERVARGELRGALRARAQPGPAPMGAARRRGRGGGRPDGSHELRASRASRASGTGLGEAL